MVSFFPKNLIIDLFLLYLGFYVCCRGVFVQGRRSLQEYGLLNSYLGNDRRWRTEEFWGVQQGLDLARFPVKDLRSVGSVKDAAARVGDWLVTVSCVGLSSATDLGNTSVNSPCNE